MEPEEIEKRIPNLIEIGIRAVKLCYHKNSKIYAVYALIPTKWCHWLLDLAYRSEWEGSYIPLIIYKSGVVVVLAPAGEEEKWEKVRRKISECLSIEVKLAGD